MRKSLRFVGLDVHKESIAVAVAESGRGGAQLLETIAADELLLLKLLDWLGPKSRLRVCYEAGPTGYGLAHGSRSKGSAVWWWRLRWCPRKPIVASRPIVGMQFGWRTSCVRAIWWRFRFPRRKRKRCAI
jgi:hypothetical protein